MSAIDTSTSSGRVPSATVSGLSTLGTDEFLNIMLTELQSQDPLEPQDSQALLDQFSSLYQIESNVALGDSLTALVKQSEFASASTLIGSLVSGISIDNRRVADLVVSVSNTEDGPILNLLDGSRVMFGNVDEVVGPIDLGGTDDEASDESKGTGDDGGEDEGDDGVTPTAAESVGSGEPSANDDATTVAAAGSSGSTGFVERIDAVLAGLGGAVA